MRSWTYPLHLIDFETAAVALPFHAGRRPYEQVGFQFSHHVLEADGSLRHADQFLCDDPGVFPNYAFVRALRSRPQAPEVLASATGAKRSRPMRS